jgi:hypothetical protein
LVEDDCDFIDTWMKGAEVWAKLNLDQLKGGIGEQLVYKEGRLLWGSR